MMKIWVTTLLMTILVVAVTFLPEATPRRDEDGIQVVTGRAQPSDAWSVTAPRKHAMAVAPSVSSPVNTAGIDPQRPDDEVALAELFTSQSRDAVWASETEGAIRSRSPQVDRVTCAEFMCRIEIRSNDRFDRASADQLADTTSRSWTKELSYNRYTAIISGSPGATTLIFYATKTANRLDPS